VAEPQLDVGLGVLKQDHADLDKVLDDFTRYANRLIKLSSSDEIQAHEDVRQVQKTSKTIEAFLKRHLSDEEELAVPIILKHLFRSHKGTYLPHAMNACVASMEFEMLSTDQMSVSAWSLMPVLASQLQLKKPQST